MCNKPKPFLHRKDKFEIGNDDPRINHDSVYYDDDKIRIQATLEDLEEGVCGGCIACGHVQEHGVEPDARNYRCEECLRYEVYGLEELCLMDQIDIIDEDE